jgi:isopentenyl phosphate kinase
MLKRGGNTIFAVKKSRGSSRSAKKRKASALQSRNCNHLIVKEGGVTFGHLSILT